MLKVRKLSFSGLMAGTFIFLVQAEFALAQSQGGTISTQGGTINTPPSGGTSVSLVNPLNTTDFTVVLKNISSFLLIVAAPLCAIMVVIGGFQMITAAGNPEKFSNGRKTLIYAAVGFVIVLFATSVVPLLKSILNGG